MIDREDIEKFKEGIVTLTILLILAFLIRYIYDYLTFKEANFCSEDYRCEGQSPELKEPLCRACFYNQTDLNSFEKRREEDSG